MHYHFVSKISSLNPIKPQAFNPPRPSLDTSPLLGLRKTCPQLVRTKHQQQPWKRPEPTEYIIWVQDGKP